MVPTGKIKLMDIHEIRRHNARLLASHLGTLSAFAERIGKAQTYVSRFLGKRPTREIGPNMAKEIEAAFGKEKGWLDVIQNSVDSNHKASVDQPKKIESNVSPLSARQGISLVPLISWVQAGAFCENTDILTHDQSEELLPCPVSIGRHGYALTVQGDSMTSPYPGVKSYPEGCVIYVDPDGDITNGCSVVAHIDGTDQVTFKTYVEDAGEKFLKPINPQYKTIDITEHTQICGVVVCSMIRE